MLADLTLFISLLSIACSLFGAGWEQVRCVGRAYGSSPQVSVSASVTQSLSLIIYATMRVMRVHLELLVLSVVMRTVTLENMRYDRPRGLQNAGAVLPPATRPSALGTACDRAAVRRNMAIQGRHARVSALTGKRLTVYSCTQLFGPKLLGISAGHCLQK